MSDFYNKYPYTDFHELNLDWIIERVKQLTEDWLETKQAWENTEADWQELYDYVHDYFDNLNVQTEINNKIDAMILDGTFQQIATPIIQAKVAADLPGVVSDQIGSTVASQIDATVASQIGATVASQIDDAVVSPVNTWLTTHITQPTTPVVDTSLSISGAAADAAVTGEKLSEIMLKDVMIDIVSLATTEFRLLNLKAGDRLRVTNNSGASSNMSLNSGTPGSVIQSLGDIPDNTTTDFTVLSDAAYFRAYISSAATIGGNISVIVDRFGVITMKENISTISGAVTALGNEIDFSIENSVNGNALTRKLMGNKIQFLPDKSEWLTGYWDSSDNYNIHSDNSYRAYKVYELPAGTYHINNFAQWQSFVQDIKNNTYTALYYLVSGDAFTVSYPFNLLISSSQVNTNSMFANAALPTDYVYGAYPAPLVQKIYHVEKNGTGDYDKLVDAINEACQYDSSIVYVGPGTWDIIDELGSTYLNNVSVSQRGLVLKNHVHVICSSNSIITADYTGSGANVMTWLAVFNAGVNGFTLENANIQGSNIRYLIHDERDQDTDAYVNKYINCKFYFDNSGNTEWSSKQVIGGGLGQNGYIEIAGCDFDTVGSGPVVSYHNTGAATGKSSIHIHDCYLRRYCNFRFSWYGTSTEMSHAYVDSCYMGNTILVEAEGGASVVNIDCTEWNNTVRS